MGFFNRYHTPSDLPSWIPVFPLSGALLLPRAELPLNIFEPRYLAMVDHALSAERLIGIIQPAAGRESDAVPPLMKVGCVGRIVSYTETADERMLITLAGVCRFQVVSELDVITPYRQVNVNYHPFAVDLASEGGASEVNRPALLKAFRDYLAANNMKPTGTRWTTRPRTFWSTPCRCSPPMTRRKSRRCWRRPTSRRGRRCWWP
jgi:Lon protease-like protein